MGTNERKDTPRFPSRAEFFRLNLIGVVAAIVLLCVVVYGLAKFEAKTEAMRRARLESELRRSEEHTRIDRRLDDLVTDTATSIALWERVAAEVDELDKRTPCDGCFDSLKWRVDELRALHGIGVQEPEGAHEREVGQATGKGDQER